MVQGPKKSGEALRLLRKAARRTNKEWEVRQITDDRGRSRGDGSHMIWGVYDAEGEVLARSSVTTHPGDMSWTVTRGFEQDFEDLFGKGWMDR
jgi:hypothetical protein